MIVQVALAIAALGCPSPPERAVQGDASAGLVFVRRSGSDDELFRARLADGRVRAFLSEPGRDLTWPYWSEAVRRLVYQSEPRGGAAELEIWKPGDASAQPLAAAPTRDVRWATWSPDGSRVAFAFRDGRESGIAEIEVPGGREVSLAHSGARDLFFRPGFAPDGRRLVAQRRGPDGQGSELWLLAPPEAPHRLTREEGWFEQKPFFTRDGAWVVFARDQGNGLRELVRVAADGQVAPIAAGAPGADEHSARPSPTRDELAFVSDRDGTRDIFLAPLASGPARNLTRTSDRDEFAPHWSPNGELLVVTAAPRQPPGRAGDRIDPADARLVVLDRSGRVLLETGGMMPDWMPPF